MNKLSAINTDKLTNYKNQDSVEKKIESITNKSRGSRSFSEKVRLFQLKLYDKAKREKDYRFYILYDKIFLIQTLEVAYHKVKSKGGSSPGVDGQTIVDIEKYGKEKFLADLSEDLRKKSYQPQPVKRVFIDKEDGSKRPLGIPTIRDRIAQTACKLVIEPIFEADFEDSSYGFRPNRKASDAIRAIKSNLYKGLTEVYDADLSKFFDKIPHDKLMKTLSLRISDKRVLQLINLWLKSPVDDGGKYTGGKRNKVGAPQGGVISPLLSNIYLHLLDKIVRKSDGHYRRAGVEIIRFADDFILMSRKMPEGITEVLAKLLARMGLQINEEKSKVLDVGKEPLEYLGFEIRYAKSILHRDGRKYWSIIPSPKSQRKLRQKLRLRLRHIGHYGPSKVAAELNPILRGWLNYFDQPGLSHIQIARQKLRHYLSERLYRYYSRKSQRRSKLSRRDAYTELTTKYGLIQVYTSSKTRPVNAMSRNL